MSPSETFRPCYMVACSKPAGHSSPHDPVDGVPATMDYPTSESVPVLSTEECRHSWIVTYRHGDLRMWSCGDCHIRFYPACPVCVDVGHRNIEHPAALTSEAHRG